MIALATAIWIDLDPVSCRIPASRLEDEMELYQNDRDFEVIAKVRGLRLYRPPKP